LSAGHAAAAKRFSGIKGVMGSRYLQTNGCWRAINWVRIDERRMIPKRSIRESAASFTNRGL
jgi:hypothetical protein